MKIKNIIVLLLLHISLADAAREAVLRQIDLPHNYYFREMYLPQVSSGPTSVSFAPDGQTLVYSMAGHLWRQKIGSDEAQQLTDGSVYDHQPDWSPDGQFIVFVRYQHDAMELWRVDGDGRHARALTNNKAVNVEPRLSPDGHHLAFVSTQRSGHFDLWLAKIDAQGLHDAHALASGEQTTQPRYYYSSFDHYLNPSWTPDSQQLVFVNNHQISYGSGDLCRAAIDHFADRKCFWREETSWQTHPEVAPDGKRVLFSSYHGRQHHQLWLTTLDGDAAFPLTFGDFDRVNARWSSDGQRFAYISNESGNTALYVQEVVGGARQLIEARSRHYLRAQQALTLQLRDAQQRAVSARISLVDEADRAYVANDKWWHSDDSFDRRLQSFETGYFHCQAQCTVQLPVNSRYRLRVNAGFDYQVSNKIITTNTAPEQVVVVPLTPLQLPAEFGRSISADLHVHSNYGGHYRQNNENLAQQALAEHLGVIYNLIVNKEQRVPDVALFTPQVFTHSGVRIFQAQEFHTSFWGHLGLMHLNDHLLLPDFSAYQISALSSPFPHNGVIADLAHQQGGLVGYVHPFDEPVDPINTKKLSHQLPADVAQGKIDYYEVLGFSDHFASADVWHRLLNLGFHLSAGAGTDAMSNYASLRGPVGVNRVYLRTADQRAENLSAALKQGASYASNFAQLGFSVAGKLPGETITLDKAQRVAVRVALRAIAKARFVEVLYNGDVVKSLINKPVAILDSEFDMPLTRSGWLSLRAYDREPQRDVLDIYPYAETSPIYINVANEPVHSPADAHYFVVWLDRVIAATLARDDFNNESEKQQTIRYLQEAKTIYLNKQ